MTDCANLKQFLEPLRKNLPDPSRFLVSDEQARALPLSRFLVPDVPAGVLSLSRFLTPDEQARLFDAFRRISGPPVSPQRYELQPEALPAEPVQQAKPAQQAGSRKLTKKQAEVVETARRLYPDPKVLDTISTTAITDEVNEDWKRRGNKGNLATDKTVATVLGREPRHIPRRKPRRNV